VDVVALLVIIVLLLAIVAIIGGPLRPGREQAAASRDEARVEDLLAAKDAKYREIRELELDHRTGKVTDADFRVLDRQLRAEAIEILRALDALGAGEPPDGDGTP
jgi:hypothetical protein